MSTLGGLVYDTWFIQVICCMFVIGMIFFVIQLTRRCDLMKWIDKVKSLLKRDEVVQKDMELEQEEVEEVSQDGKEDGEGDGQRVAV